MSPNSQTPKKSTPSALASTLRNTADDVYRGFIHTTQNSMALLGLLLAVVLVVFGARADLRATAEERLLSWLLERQESSQTVERLVDVEPTAIERVTAADIGDVDAGNTYFTISVDADTGVVTFEQTQNIYHPDETNHDDSQSLDLEPGSLAVSQVVTDADGDTATATLTVLIIDDQPIALPEGGSITTSLSIGIALYPEHADNPEALVHEADVAMYHAKRSQLGRIMAKSQDSLTN